MKDAMNHPEPNLEHLLLNRRQLLTRCGTGMGMLSLASLLGEEAGAAPEGAASRALNPLAPRSPHFPGKVKRVIHIFLNGGPSQVDTFDPKPMLTQYNGQPMPTPNLKTERKTGNLLKSPF